MKQLTLAMLGCLGLVSAAPAMDLCEHSAERNLDVDASGIEALNLLARAGELEVRGEAGLEQVVVRGKACASDADRLDAIQLTHGASGGILTVAVEMPEQVSGWFGNSYQRLDLDVRVPARLALDLADSSGEARVRGVASAKVQDSSGELVIEDIAGDLQVTDSSGDIDVRNIGGDFLVPMDSSGDIDAREVAGNVRVLRDSSGDIRLREVRGDARVENDSSGDIRFADVDGSAFVGTDSSGSILAERIGRDFTVERDSSGGIRHEDVAGQVSVPEEH